MIVPTILCGGSGTRLWPLSRRFYPKQFHALTGNLSLFQETVRRCCGATGADRVILLTNEDYRHLLTDQLDSIGVRDRTVILEPASRNTASAIALAALHLAETDPQTMMLVAPSDHFIQDDAAFHKTIRTAERVARSDAVVTLGIEPTHPATGYGYIKSSETEDRTGAGCFRVERFVEKPDAETAAAFLSDSSYYWNSGMFVFTAGVYLEELEKFQPDIMEACNKAWHEMADQYGFLSVGPSYKDAPALSIDYAIMEKTDKSIVVPHSGDWSDIGSWTGLADTGRRDRHGNTVTGNVELHNVSNSLVYAKDRLVTGIGLSDAIIVETKDAVMVSVRGQDQDVRHVVERLKSTGKPEVDFHTEVLRPWGSYEDLDKGDGFHVKRLTIKPGASISLQRHFHRSEHWVVVKGEARVIRNDEEFVLRKNESTDIPKEAVHKLMNLGSEDLVIVEVQTGDWLDESDIERLKDDYGRL